MRKYKPVVATECEEHPSDHPLFKEDPYTQLTIEWMFGTASLRKEVESPVYNEQGVWTTDGNHLAVLGTKEEIIQQLQTYQENIISQWLVKEEQQSNGT